MAKMISVYLAILGLFSLFLCTAHADNVPVLIWSPSRSMVDLPQSMVGKTVNSKGFHDQYLSQLSSPSDNVVVFVQDQLNLEDFTQYADVYNPYSDGGSFHNIKTLMDEQFSVHLPSVETPMQSIEVLSKAKDKNVLTVSKSADVRSLPTNMKGMLVIVRLNPVVGKTNIQEALAANDKYIKDVVHELSKRGIEYTAIYTAETSQANLLEDIPLGRQLLEVKNMNGSTFVNESGCLFLYMEEAKIDIKNTDGDIYSTVLPPDPDSTGSTCGNDSAVIKLKYKNGSSTIDIEINIMVKRGDWNISSNSIKVSGTSKHDGEVELDMTEVASPSAFSFHCSSLGPLVNRNKSEIEVKLGFKEFQLQPTGIKNDQFAPAWDCVTFFSPAIWMGIFVTIIMVLILFFGMNMLSSITTQDRYDDPKGKTITVSTTD